MPITYNVEPWTNMLNEQVGFAVIMYDYYVKKVSPVYKTRQEAEAHVPEVTSNSIKE